MSSSRNTRLSAYYKLPASPALPKTRNEGLSHAENLTKTLPLEQLLTHAANQKTRCDNLQKQLHTATLSHYQHLQSALQTAQQVHSQSQQLTPGTDSIANAIALSRRVEEELKDTRALVRSLEAVRRVEQLITATDILASEFPKLADELPLCTDPQRLHDQIFLSSQRYSSIRPAVGKLATVDKSLRHKVEALDQAASTLSKSLISEQTVLNRGDVASVRLLLADDRATVEKDFITAVVEDTLHRRLSEKAISGTPLKRCVLRVEFFTSHVLEDLLKDVETYEELFGKCRWVDDVAYDALADVRNELRDVLGDVSGVEGLRVCLKTLGGRGNAGRRAAEDIEKVVEEVALGEGVARFRGLVGEIGDLDKNVIVERVNDLKTRLVSVLNWDENKVESLLRRVISQTCDAKEAAGCACLCEVLLRHGWKVVGSRDTAVERCVEGVLQQFRSDLKGDDDEDKFVQVVVYVSDVGRGFDVDGLVDDDLGEGFGHRVLGGMVEIVREMGLNHEMMCNVERIVDGVNGVLDVDALRIAIEERRFGEGS